MVCYRLVPYYHSQWPATHARPSAEQVLSKARCYGIRYMAVGHPIAMIRYIVVRHPKAVVAMAGHTCQTFCRTSPTNCDDSIHCSSPSKDCCSQARSMVVRHLIVQAAEQVLPTAMTRYMVVVLARLGALGHP